MKILNIFGPRPTNTGLHGLMMLLTLTLVAAGWLVSMGIHRQVLAAENQEIAERELLEEAAQFEATQHSLLEELGHLQKQISLLQDTLPDSPNEAAYLSQLSVLASHCDVTMSDFRPGSVLTQPQFKEIELRLRCSGTYANLCRWFAGLKSLPRIARISHVNIAAPAGPELTCAVDLQLNLVFAVQASTQLANKGDL